MGCSGPPTQPILNLSTEVADPKYANNRKAPRSKHSPDPEPGKATKSTRRNRPLQLSVNNLTEPAEDQFGVKALGPALPSILKFMFDTNCTWEIDWQKIYPSDGFWCMIISTGAEHNFAFQMPTQATDTDTFFMVPLSLQMGWKNSLEYFCVATQTTRELVRCMLALTINTGITEPHQHKHHCQQSPPPQPKPEWQTPTDMTIMSMVFVDDFCNGIAGPPN
jgi:hypothetical protein